MQDSLPHTAIVLVGNFESCEVGAEEVFQWRCQRNDLSLAGKTDTADGELGGSGSSHPSSIDQDKSGLRIFTYLQEKVECDNDEGASVANAGVFGGEAGAEGVFGYTCGGR